jgi:hypothetical protein
VQNARMALYAFSASIMPALPADPEHPRASMEEQIRIKTDLQTVYVLVNPAMPGIVKIGMTRESDAGARIAALSSSTAVPLPFECVYACNVPDALTVERAIHRAFGPDRINPSREFFRIESSRVVAILELLHEGQNVTEKVEADAEERIPSVDLESAKRDKRKMRPKINYIEIGLKVGDTITFKDGTTTATIAGPHTVTYEGTECSLQSVTQKLMPEFVGKGVESKTRWYFGDRLLADMYEDFHDREDE